MINLSKNVKVGKSISSIGLFLELFVDMANVLNSEFPVVNGVSGGLRR